MRVVERTIDKHGHSLLMPDIEVDGGWTSLTLEEQQIIDLYSDHGTSEQFHSEFKTDLDIECLPSGKFATNRLVLSCAALSYNLLRWMGQTGLTGKVDRFATNQNVDALKLPCKSSCTWLADWSSRHFV